MKKKALIILGVLLALVPLGLLTDNPAWGEWDLEYYKEKLGFIPKGMESASTIHPIIPDYEVPGLGSISGYYISAVVGVILVFAIYFILAKTLKAKNDS
jgi:cobalt/nickel transport protein